MILMMKRCSCHEFGSLIEESLDIKFNEWNGREMKKTAAKIKIQVVFMIV